MKGLQKRKQSQSKYYNKHTQECIEFQPQEDIIFLKDNVWIIKKDKILLCEKFVQKRRPTHIRKRVLDSMTVENTNRKVSY